MSDTKIYTSVSKSYPCVSGITLPENVLAVPDVVESVTDADILVWVLPHQVCIEASIVGIVVSCEIYSVSNYFVKVLLRDFHSIIVYLSPLINLDKY